MIKNMKYIKTCDIPVSNISGVKFDGYSSITKDGTTLYSLKIGSTGDDQSTFVIYRTTNFTTKPKTTLIKPTKNKKVIKKICRHCNSITFAKGPKDNTGYLFVATMNDADKCQAIMLTTNGEIKKELLYRKKAKYVRFMSIDFIGVDEKDNYKFVVGLVGRKEKKCRYDIVTLKDNILVYSGITFYSQPIMFASNDILYIPSKKRFYNSFYTATSDGKIGTNYIYTYNIDLNNLKKNGTEIKPVNTIITEVTSPLTFFEVEGLVAMGETIYIAANAGIKEWCDQDGVYKLKS